ncbi:MAG TPA: family 20 glycosylhydrolase [Gemmatimonadales bacterium]|jgi:hexosaminidase
MRFPTLIPALFLLAAPITAQQPSVTLMPMPASLTLTAARLALDTSFTVALPHVHDARLERAVTRAVRRLSMRIARPLPYQYALDTAATLIVDVAASGHAIPELDDDESYTLQVSDHRAVLTAPNVVGAIRGLETLLQLQAADASGLYFQGADIRDTPRFRWRGLLLDVSRHFEPVDVVKRTLDGMAMVKLNVLHWHLSDDQGFRVESRKEPRLQEFGSDGLYYTQDEIRDVVAYAADRGIRVMPEFDVPGHSSSWFVGYPELTVGSGPFSIARTWGTFVPTMDPTRESTYHFLDTVIGEISGLFPDKYWHVGGDEVDPKQWKTTATIQDYMRAHGLANEVALHTAFNRRLFEIVQKHGRIPVGWDEIFQPDLPTSAVIQSWRSSDALAASARAGFHGILSAPYYIDHMKTAADVYLADPIPVNTTLTPAQQALVLGGEACLWGEYVTPDLVDSRLWPRLAAVAERFWSPGSVTDVPDMYRRLAVTSHRLEEVGLRHEEHVARAVTWFAGDSSELFQRFIGYIRPRDFGGNGPNQMYPHTALVDAALPDPPAAAALMALARRAVQGDTAALGALQDRFAEMSGFQDRLAAVAVELPAARDGAMVAGLLRNIGVAGGMTVDALRHRDLAAAGWSTTADSLLRLAVPKAGGMRPVGADAVRVLLQSVR